MELAKDERRKKVMREGGYEGAYIDGSPEAGMWTTEPTLCVIQRILRSPSKAMLRDVTPINAKTSSAAGQCFEEFKPGRVQQRVQ